MIKLQNRTKMLLIMIILIIKGEKVGRQKNVETSAPRSDAPTDAYILDRGVSEKAREKVTYRDALHLKRMPTIAVPCPHPPRLRPPPRWSAEKRFYKYIIF